MANGKIADQIAEEIIEIVGKATNEGMRYPVMSGVVRDVDADGGTCDVELSVDDEGQATPGIITNVVTDNMEGLTMVPVIGSQVWVAEIDGPGKWGLVKCSELQTVVVKIGDTAELEVTSGVVVLNGGENGGLVKVQELVDKINRLESKVNGLVTKYNAHTHLYNPGPGTPVVTATPPVTETAITPVTTVANIENPNVKH
jgi:tetrahydromethanopterin S-methyltransferase subunit B